MACIENSVVRNVISLDISATFADAARLMAERGIGSVGVLRGDELVGLVTDRDLVEAVSLGADPARSPLSGAMRGDFPTVSPRATDAECAQLMRRHRTRHLLVKEGEALVGVISMLDLVDLVVEDKQWSIDQLESYIRGGRASQLSTPLTTLFAHEHGVS